MKINCRQIIRSFCVTVFMLCLAPIFIAAQNGELKIPTEVKLFFEKGSKAIAVESADLNGDGTLDFILVTEPLKPEAVSDEDNGDERTLSIIVRDRAGKLTLAKRNNEVVYCKSCGGAFGDPFESIEAKPGSFTVYNYGGSAWRWGDHYQFNYSRIDKTWQLVRAESLSYHSSDPNKMKTKIRTPKTFGKIDIADFKVDSLKF